MKLLVVDDGAAGRDRALRALTEEFGEGSIQEVSDAAELAAALDDEGINYIVGGIRLGEPARQIVARQAAVLREQTELLDLTHDAVIVRDMHATILFWNRGAEEHYGWSREEAVGHRTHTLLRNESSQPMEEVNAVLERDGYWTGELVQTRRDGSRLVVDSRWTLKRDIEGRPAAVLEINTDITKRKRAEEALRESEARYRQMFERNRAIKLLVDAETGEIVQANPSACDYYGYTLEQLQAMRIWQLNTLPAKEVQAQLQRALTQERSTFIFRHRLASGVLRDVEVNASPIDIQGRHLIYSIIHDITDRKQAETALWHHTKRLQILHDIDQAILALKSPQEIAQSALRHLRQVVPARYAGVVLNDPASQEGTVLAVDAAAPTRVQPGEHLPLLWARLPVEQWRSNVYLIQDLSTMTEAMPAAIEALRQEGIQGYLSVPLLVRNELIGRLELGSVRPNQFGLSHLDICRHVADSLAVAIQNARLYEGEQRARQTAETLRAANLALTESLDLHSVLDTLLVYMQRLVPYQSACVMLTDDDAQAVTLRAHHGYDHWLDPDQVRDLEGLTLELENTPTIAAVLSGEKSLLIQDTALRQDWQPGPGSEQIRNWLGVPLITQGRCIGLCSLDQTQPGFFTEEHARMAEAIAAQAAVAILNARLYDEVRMGRQHLQTLSRRQVDVQERERRHVARELHDEAGQALTSLMVSLGLLERDAGCSQPIVAQLENLKHMVDGVLEDLHSLAVNLRPAVLDHLGLVPALRQYVESTRRQSGLLVEFETLGLTDERLPSDSETSIYRIVQEALTNVVRHAHAEQAGVLLERRGESIVAIVEDNGQGFDVEQAFREGQLGLVGIRERAQMLNGKLVVESSTGQGTSVYLEIPYSHTSRS